MIAIHPPSLFDEGTLSAAVMEVSAKPGREVRELVNEKCGCACMCVRLTQGSIRHEVCWPVNHSGFEWAERDRLLAAAVRICDERMDRWEAGA